MLARYGASAADSVADASGFAACVIACSARCVAGAAFVGAAIGIDCGRGSMAAADGAMCNSAGAVTDAGIAVAGELDADVSSPCADFGATLVGGTSGAVRAATGLGGVAMLCPIDALIASLNRIGDAMFGIGIGTGLLFTVVAGRATGACGGAAKLVAGDDTDAFGDSVGTGAGADMGLTMLVVCASAARAASRSATLTAGRSGAAGGGTVGISTR